MKIEFICGNCGRECTWMEQRWGFYKEVRGEDSHLSTPDSST